MPDYISESVSKPEAAAEPSRLHEEAFALSSNQLVKPPVHEYSIKTTLLGLAETSVGACVFVGGAFMHAMSGGEAKYAAGGFMLAGALLGSLGLTTTLTNKNLGLWELGSRTDQGSLAKGAFAQTNVYDIYRQSATAAAMPILGQKNLCQINLLSGLCEHRSATLGL